MSLIFIVLPIALAVAAAAVIAYLWAARSGQFDDLETPRHRILWEEEDAAARENGSDEAEEPTSRNRE
jgi:cbb3-type cytochrome oxidase maturation protein